MLRLPRSTEQLLIERRTRKPEDAMTKKIIIAGKPSVANAVARNRIYERAPAR